MLIESQTRPGYGLLVSTVIRQDKNAIGFVAGAIDSYSTLGSMLAKIDVIATRVALRD